jgi:hypothetical protein
VTVVEQSVDDMRADEARAAGDENLHGMAGCRARAARMGMYRLS